MPNWAENEENILIFSNMKSKHSKSRKEDQSRVIFSRHSNVWDSMKIWKKNKHIFIQTSIWRLSEKIITSIRQKISHATFFSTKTQHDYQKGTRRWLKLKFDMKKSATFQKLQEPKTFYNSLIFQKVNQYPQSEDH